MAQRFPAPRIVRHAVLVLAAMSGCGATPTATVLADEQGLPWLTLGTDGRIVHASGEEAGRFDPSSGALAVPEVPEPIDVTSDPAVRRESSGLVVALFGERCALAPDGAVDCPGIRGRVTPPLAIDDPRAAALLLAAAIYRPPQPVGASVAMTALELRLEPLIAQGGAAPDGTLWSGGVCPTWSASCDAEPAGRYSDAAVSWRGVEVPRPAPDPSKGCAVQRPTLCVGVDAGGAWTVAGWEHARVSGAFVTLRPRDEPPPAALGQLALIAVASALAEAIDAVAVPPPPPPPPPP